MKVINYLKHPKKIIEYSLNKNYFFFIPDALFLKIKFKIMMNSKLNLKKPITFNEKLQWLKLYDRNPLYTKLVDKYAVREYIKDKIGDKYLIPLLGVYDHFDDIDFSSLPNKFVIKCNHDSGSVIVCKNKKKLDIKASKRKIEKALKRNYYYGSREWPYKNVVPKIIIEKYMENKNREGLIDYKFYCFNGCPKFLYISVGLDDHQTASMDFFNMDLKQAPFGRSDYRHLKEMPKMPQNFDKMKEIAASLSKNIPFIRIDLYEINNQVYFSEATFFPCSGLMPFEPVEYDEKIGDMLVLPNKKGNKYEK